METVTAHGADIPVIGLGTWQLRGNACRSAVEQALALGYRHIDTARMYENEAQVGAGIRASGVDRGEVFVTTKIWGEDLAYDRAKAAIADSVRTLGIGYVDLLLIHWPSRSVPLDRTLGAMLEAQDAGLVHHLGVSNFNTELLQRALAQAPIACNQIEYHPYLGQGAVVELARRSDVAIAAYCPLAKGRVAGDETLVGIGHGYGKSAGQVALRWLIQQSGVVALPKSSGAHLAENLDVFDFELNEAEMATIFGLHEQKRLISPGWAPKWD